MELDNFSKHCGSISSIPWTFISKTNTLPVTFKYYGTTSTGTGFLAVWSATTEPPTYPLTGCDNCDFPFTFGDATFDTCISVLGVDTKPWCSYQLSPPTNSGTHILPSPKISCSDSDSSCPTSSPQTVITSPNYPGKYSNIVDEVK